MIMSFWTTVGLGLLPLLGLLIAGAGNGGGDGSGGSGGGAGDGGAGSGGGDPAAGGDGGKDDGKGGKPPETPPAPAPYQVKVTDAQRERLLKDGVLDLSEEQYTGGVRHQMDTLKRRATSAEKQLSDIAAAQEEKERAALVEQEKFKELYEKERQKGEALAATRKDDLVRSRFLLAAQSKGAVDPDAAFLIAKGLATFGTVQVSDEGAVTGVDELVEALKTEKPYLFSSQTKPQSVGSPSNPGQSTASAPKTLAEAGDQLESALRTGV
jgi:hypothetical protein